MNMPKYMKIKYLGEEDNRDIFLHNDDDIVIEEKMDGSQTRIYVKDGKVYVGTHHVVIGELNELLSKGAGRYERAVKFFAEKIQDVDLHEYDNLVLFGESMFKHTLDYDWVHIPPILFFDVYDVIGDRYYNYKEKALTIGSLDLPIVPLVSIKSAKELRETQINDTFVPQSKWRHGQAEGIVFKNYKRQIFAKYVRAKFKEINREVFGMNKKYAHSDEEKIVAAYCTNPRIYKMIYELQDEGHGLSMELMKYLPKRVWEDIVEEEGKEILNGRYVLDLKKIRNRIAKRCLVVLKQAIVNNVLTGGENEV